MIVVYAFDEANDRIGVVSIQDARSGHSRDEGGAIRRGARRPCGRGHESAMAISRAERSGR
jgi:hypothetical protein